MTIEEYERDVLVPHRAKLQREVEVDAAVLHALVACFGKTWWREGLGKRMILEHPGSDLPKWVLYYWQKQHAQA